MVSRLAYNLPALEIILLPERPDLSQAQLGAAFSVLFPEFPSPAPLHRAEDPAVCYECGSLTPPSLEQEPAGALG